MPQFTSTGAFKPGSLHRRWPAQNNSLLEAILLVIPAGKTIIDLGAGAGTLVAKLREAGRCAWGVDGIEGVERLTGGLVQHADLTQPIDWRRFGLPKDWATCIEVGEHIPVALQETFLDNLAQAATDGLVISWATKTQHGRGHVNLREPGEVAEMLKARGWKPDWLASRKMRRRARRPFKKKLLVMRR